MSDFAKFCPKCYAFFRDPDLYTKHVEGCGFARDRKEAAGGRPPSAKTTDSRRQTTGRGTADGGRQTAGKRSQEAEKVENSPATVEEQSAADYRLLSADSDTPPTDTPPSVKPAKFKT